MLFLLVFYLLCLWNVALQLNWVKKGKCVYFYLQVVSPSNQTVKPKYLFKIIINILPCYESSCTYGIFDLRLYILILNLKFTFLFYTMYVFRSYHKEFLKLKKFGFNKNVFVKQGFSLFCDDDSDILIR